MKKLLLIVLIINCLGSIVNAQSPNSPMVYWSSDSTVAWAMTIEKKQGNSFEINAIARAMKDIKLTGVASMTIEASDTCSVDMAYAKQIGAMGQIIITRKIHVKDKGSHSVSGQLTWYVKGETSIRNLNFTLPFEN